METLLVKEIQPREIMPGYHGRLVHSDRMTFVYWDIDEGAPLPEHSHPHEQVAHVLEGEFEITINGETSVLTPGSVTVIPSNATHSGKALTMCRIMDAFAPVREDYL